MKNNEYVCAQNQSVDIMNQVINHKITLQDLLSSNLESRSCCGLHTTWPTSDRRSRVTRSHTWDVTRERRDPLQAGEAVHSKKKKNRENKEKEATWQDWVQRVSVVDRVEEGLLSLARRN